MQFSSSFDLNQLKKNHTPFFIYARANEKGSHARQYRLQKPSHSDRQTVGHRQRGFQTLTNKLSNTDSPLVNDRKISCQ